MFKKLFALMVITAAFTAQIAAAKDLSEARVREIVEQYIKENGGVVAASVDTYLAEERNARAAALVKPETPVFGAKNGQISVIEFSDYRCGFCRRVQETMTKLRDEYGERVTFAFKAMPILSQESEDAAVAALAAHRQGKFWEFDEGLWENQSRLGSDLFLEIAKKIGLDMKRFERDLKDPTLLAQVATDRQEGQNFGAEGTPFFLINGEAFGGAQPYENFVRAIDAALASTDKG